jgi:uncharacterized cupin superfamily protein
MREAELEATDAGRVPAGPGWFVLNARDARWIERTGRGNRLPCTGYTDGEVASLFPQLGVNILVLEPGEPIGMYHWEADQEDFLVLSGSAVLIIEGEERPLRAWDFVHCPPGTAHMIVATGEDRCVVLAVGARQQRGDDWGGYVVDEAAIRHGAGLEQETTDAAVAYARFPPAVPTAYRDGWLPAS